MPNISESAAEKLDLSPVYDSFLQLLPESGEMCRANLKPRLRMTALYYYANKWNYLVAGTSNKSERMMGYFTKHGDGGADLLPIGDLTKTQVRNLARQLGIPSTGSSTGRRAPGYGPGRPMKRT